MTMCGLEVKPRGPSEVTLDGVPFTERPPNPGEVTDEGAPLICALLCGANASDAAISPKANTEAEIERFTTT